ncbi:class I SAM-dependent methyltransferase [Alicyclobacillus fastidiosus]|uniref:Class I SAM-dependent methyltransferase n=1 Tax=Alicyclobacillus fastidiosus TaxID=392011 RepID=A0ABV5AHM7_9BACL|nr:class I SAM-dependent methyltransferase [Alicyclobacillus fastidiosus]WEH11522.1 class I SAM-dependent methyltransferase [Alicyclobacillus fastidiosus]
MAKIRGNTVSCPLCGSSNCSVFCSKEEISSDIAYVKGYFQRRFQDVPAYMFKDTCDFMYDDPCVVYSCCDCSSIFRDPNSITSHIEELYQEDEYPIDLLDHLWNRYQEEYTNDKTWLTSLGLQKGSRVLEIGSHVGAFLWFAQEQGWDAEGLDIGNDVSTYARSKGLKVSVKPFNANDYEKDEFNAIIILNCFEHFDEPKLIIEQLNWILKPGGLLAIRTPNADFIWRTYKSAFKRLFFNTLLGNNLLGISFPKCYSSRCAMDLLSSGGFEPVILRGRELTSVAPQTFYSNFYSKKQLRDMVYRLFDLQKNQCGYPWMDIVSRKK